jgi:aminopeptidase YwaD
VIERIRHNLFVPLLATALWASALSAAETLAAKPTEMPRDLKVEVQPEGAGKKVTFKAKDLYEHIKFLASDECEGRYPGTPGHALAQKYLLERLKKIGFDDIRRQKFDFVSDVKLDGGNALSVHLDKASEIKSGPLYDVKPAAGGGVTLDFKVDLAFRPLRFSTSAAVENAELVFAGYGISAPDKGYDDYAGLDVKGKVVLLLRTEPETSEGKRIGKDKPDPHAEFSVYSDFFYKASTARDKGAAAVILVNGPRGMSDSERTSLISFGHGSRTECGLPFLQVFPEVADDLLQLAGKKLESAQSAIDATLKPQSFAIPGVTVSLQTKIERVRTEDENVIAVLEGTDPVLKHETIVIGSHYDHLGHGNEYSLADKADMGKIHHGADDNASGCSSVLELAEALHANRKSLKRSVWIMFFGAEELGTLGSNYFVKEPPKDFNIDQVAAMLNLDMVGRLRDNRVMVYGAGTGTGLHEALDGANEPIKLEIKTTQDGFGGSDQTAFVNAGIPVLFFFTGSHADYHKPSDTVEKINVNDQARVTALVYNTAIDLINAPVRPKFVKIEIAKPMGGMGGVGLGTLPDYAYEGKGLRLSGVREKSPADKGGLKAGDVLIEMGGKKIENIQDYMNVLRQSIAGVEQSVKIQRDGKELELKVTPERR